MRHNNRKSVGFTYDSKVGQRIKKGELEDKYAEFDSAETINLIAKAIEENGHKVVRIGNVRRLLSLGKRPDVDIVFNIAEGLSGRNRESEIPLILELFGVPFVGSDALSLGLTLDKVLAKKVFVADKIPTPAFFEAENSLNLKDLKLKFPLFVKPRLEGSSKGLDENSLVRNIRQLKKQVEWIVDNYKQPALIEEFISGKEFTVAIIGNDKPRVYDPVQVMIKGKLELGDLFYTFAHLKTPDLQYLYPAKISKGLAKKIKDMALAAYKALGCRDFGRVDFRTNAKDECFVLEVNPLPSLCSDDVFMEIAKYENIKYHEVIGEILKVAFKRYNFN